MIDNKTRSSVLNTRFANAAMLLLVSFIVAACGGSKTVVTHDDSAEYRTAKTLPPLRKPGRPAMAKPGSVTKTPQPVASAPSTSETPIEVTSIHAAPLTETRRQNSIISAAVIDEQESARLLIEAPLDQAWSFLSANLKKSDITIHNRNRVAGLFSIGCRQLDSAEAPAQTRGGWLIFRRKASSSEHCSLQLVERKSQTMVSVLNRDGLEVASSAARDIFTRLLNN